MTYEQTSKSSGLCRPAIFRNPIYGPRSSEILFTAATYRNPVSSRNLPITVVVFFEYVCRLPNMVRSIPNTSVGIRIRSAIFRIRPPVVFRIRFAGLRIRSTDFQIRTRKSTNRNSIRVLQPAQHTQMKNNLQGWPIYYCVRSAFAHVGYFCCPIRQVFHLDFSVIVIPLIRLTCCKIRNPTSISSYFRQRTRFHFYLLS
jgi:hypothetical protein